MNRTQLAQFRAIAAMFCQGLDALEAAGLADPDEPETKFPCFPIPAEKIRALLPESVRRFVPDGLYSLTLSELRELALMNDLSQLARPVCGPIPVEPPAAEPAPPPAPAEPAAAPAPAPRRGQADPSLIG